MNANKIKHYTGNYLELGRPLAIFAPSVCDFLQELSQILMKDPEAKAFPDIITFAFWIRRTNLQKYKANYPAELRAIGRGTAFHIAPSNVPINFAFSLAFGLLAGNVNIIRVSSRDFPQTDIVCRHIKHLLASGQYPRLEKNIIVLSYEHDSEITDYFSAQCDARIIWGGDRTIAEIRRSPLPPRAVELTFADRYSFSLIDAGQFLAIGNAELSKLANAFYNDTYLIDQNACSSPHLIAWLTADLSADTLAAVKERFWQAVAEAAKKWEIQDIHASEKYLLACKYAAEYPALKKLRRYANYVYVMELAEIRAQVSEIRGKFGLFAETNIHSYHELLPILGKNTQTITYYGINPQELADWVITEGLLGVDRIVPFGASLELDLIWDGYDWIGSLSRRITAGR